MFCMKYHGMFPFWEYYSHYFIHFLVFSANWS